MARRRTTRRSTAGLEAQKDAAAGQLPGAHAIIAEILQILVRAGGESDNPTVRRAAAVAGAGAKPSPNKKNSKKGKGRRAATSYDRSRTESPRERTRRQAARQRVANGQDPAKQVNDASTARQRRDADRASGREPNWNRIATQRYGAAPPWMENPHGHHTVYKQGSAAARPHVERSWRVLEKHGIDPYTGPENFGWAPNRGHSVANAEAVANRLEEADRKYGTRDAVSDALVRAGRDIFDAWP